MARPHLSSFTIIGVVLLVIGIYGRVRGAAFSFDPGTPTEHGEAYYYMLVGVLMIVNGFFVMKPLPVESGQKNDTSNAEAQATKPVEPATPAAKTTE